MYRIAGMKGEIAVDSAFDFQSPTTVCLTRGNEVVEHLFPQTDQFAGQTAYFSDCIMANSPPEADGEEGLVDVAILHAIEQAARTGIAQSLNLKPRPVHPTADMLRSIEPTTRRLVL